MSINFNFLNVTFKYPNAQLQNKKLKGEYKGACKRRKVEFRKEVEEEIRGLKNEKEIWIGTAIEENKCYQNIIMGDFSAILGRQLDDSESYVGKYGLDERNDRGNMLTHFLKDQKLFAMNTFYDKKSQRKWRWIGPNNGQTKNEIDYILSSKKLSQDVTVLNSFNTGSDHRIIRA
ncbi:hypothetical protein RI129_008962 [Pyrocoelia pectoralis]|uniref:Uncharacterized protein n=1 Tax=Pyrocoelia pectoralis TaxID=417401 RepID=A0AAN7V6J0_9COLE